MAPMKTRPPPTAMPTIVPMVIVVAEAPPSPGIVVFVDWSVMLTGVSEKICPVRAMTLPRAGFCWHPAFNAIRTVMSGQ